MSSSLPHAWRRLRAALRSLRLYHLDRGRARAMRRLYRRFVAPGDLVFDVGAHVGDRTAAFRRLGARVVAVEPQPDMARVLRLLFGWRRGVTLVEAAVGAAPGSVELRLNRANPTVTTASDAFVAAAKGAEGWAEQRWDDSIEVPLTTLDALIAQHGRPAFLKIDVEGFEADVLAGLSAPVPALSFEFTTIQRDVAHRALDRLLELGGWTFNAALGESQLLVFDQPVDAAALRRWLDELPMAANSGDIYAIAKPAGGAGEEP
ncbi:MAG: FkbM family methyltransferase [Geminicoccaceae bacterium]|nr:MAG: FkbM family methyltransferase [Geminicoccaceae bacterium]